MTQTNYTVGDFLISLKNAALAGKKTVEFEKTKLVGAIAESLLRLGFLAEVKEEKGQLKVTLTYSHKEPVLSDVKLISKPGLRVYWNREKIGGYKSRSVLLISTPLGILSAKEAAKKGVGGEVIAEII